MRWHVYAVSVEPTEIVYWIDGKVVARAPQVKGGEKPMFFLLDLSLGGGWPLRSIRSRTAPRCTSTGCGCTSDQLGIKLDRMT